MRRFREPIVFLKLEVSWVLAASPIKRCFVLYATKDLHSFSMTHTTYVLELHVRCGTIRHFVDDDIYSSMSSDTNLRATFVNGIV